MPPTSRIVTRAGYTVLKSECSVDDVKKIKNELTVSPFTPGAAKHTGPPPSFAVYAETPTQFILPKHWARPVFGPETSTTLQTGTPMKAGLKFAGELRPRQVEIVEKFMQTRNGMVCVPCGVGKTVMALNIAHKIGMKTMIVVHKHFLLDQWRGEIESFIGGARIGYLYADIVDIEDKDIVIVMLQSVTKKKYPDAYFEGYGFVIWDEAHHLGAEMFSQAFRKVHAVNMLGLSATPTRADGLTKLFLWSIGPIVFQKQRKDLFADDRIRVVQYLFDSSNATYGACPRTAQGEYNRARIVNNVAGYGPRNEYILKATKVLAEAGRCILILSDRRAQLKYFETAIKERAWIVESTGKVATVGMYVGSMKQKDLDVSATCDVVLGTFSMASEAMNVPSLNVVVLTCPKANVEQSVGRILRIQMEKRTCVHLCLDYIDKHPCFRGQHAKRKALYKSNNYHILEIEMDDPKGQDLAHILQPLPPAKASKKSKTTAVTTATTATTTTTTIVESEGEEGESESDDEDDGGAYGEDGEDDGPEEHDHDYAMDEILEEDSDEVNAMDVDVDEEADIDVDITCTPTNPKHGITAQDVLGSLRVPTGPYVRPEWDEDSPAKVAPKQGAGWDDDDGPAKPIAPPAFCPIATDDEDDWGPSIKSAPVKTVKLDLTQRAKSHAPAMGRTTVGLTTQKPTSVPQTGRTTIAVTNQLVGPKPAHGKSVVSISNQAAAAAPANGKSTVSVVPSTAAAPANGKAIVKVATPNTAPAPTVGKSVIKIGTPSTAPVPVAGKGTVTIGIPSTVPAPVAGKGTVTIGIPNNTPAPVAGKGTVTIGIPSTNSKPTLGMSTVKICTPSTTPQPMEGKTTIKIGSSSTIPASSARVVKLVIPVVSVVPVVSVTSSEGAPSTIPGEKQQTLSSGVVMVPAPGKRIVKIGS